MTSRALSRSLAVVALLFSALAFAACGESAQDKAKAEVCKARTDISKQVETLTSLTASTVSPTAVKTGVESIANDLTTIKKAQSNLTPARKEQVKAATETFEKELSSILSGITSNLSLSNAESQFKSAITQLGTSFKKTLAPINCS